MMEPVRREEPAMSEEEMLERARLISVRHAFDQAGRDAATGIGDAILNGVVLLAVLGAVVLIGLLLI